MSITKKRACQCLIIFSIFFFIACGSSNNDTSNCPPAENPSLDTTTQGLLKTLLDQKIIEYSIPGMILAVKVGSKDTWIGNSGVSNISAYDTLTTTDQFRIGSNSKTFTAMTILQLAEAGSLNLDDTLDQWLPASLFTNYNLLDGYDYSNITIRQLLNHTTGLLNFSEADEWGYYYTTDRSREWTPQELIGLADAVYGPPEEEGKYLPNFQPGEGMAYSNTNYVLLGLIIEVITQSTFEQEVKTRFLDYLNLTTTTVPPKGEEDMTGNFSHGYYDLDSNQILSAISEDVSDQDPSFTWASGNMVSTASDLIIWARALGKGELINDTFFNEQTTFIDFTGHDNLKYGLGMVKDIGYSSTRTDDDLIGHQGGSMGYSSVVFYLASQDTAIICLINRALPSSVTNYAEVCVYKALEIIYPDVFPITTET